MRPSVVRRLVGRDLATPIDRPSHPVHLLANRDDVPLGHRARVAALFDRRVLGGEPERVVAHRPQNLHPLAAPEMRDDIADRVVEGVPHVEIARGVREHLDDVRRLTIAAELVGIRIRDVERPLVGPDLLPFRLDRLWVVALHRLRLIRSRVQKSLSRERLQGRTSRRRRTLPASWKKQNHCGDRTTALRSGTPVPAAAVIER